MSRCPGRRSSPRFSLLCALGGACALGMLAGCAESGPAASSAQSGEDGGTADGGGDGGHHRGGQASNGPGGGGVARNLPFGTWYLDVDTERLQLELHCDAAGAACSGTLADESTGIADPVDSVAWDAASSTLQFRRLGDGEWAFYRATLSEGVLAGRATNFLLSSGQPTDLTQWFHTLTGWKSEAWDHALSPRVYDLLLDNDAHAHLRIDRAADGSSTFDGRFKVYATSDLGDLGEAGEYDAAITEWDGTTLAFTVTDPGWTRQFQMKVSGRFVSGSWTDTAAAGAHTVIGSRAEVLSHGFNPRTAAERGDWQARVHSALSLLVMNGNPAPLSANEFDLSGDEVPYVPSLTLPDRDDTLDDVPWGDYRRREIQIDLTLPDSERPGATLSRSIHGFLAVPAEVPPVGGFPAVLAVNGHDGSAHAVMTPDDEDFWYGDSYARHGYVVLSVDISHRPWADRRGAYTGYVDGDDPANGNHAHPSIHTSGLDSDWEEDGERTWDALRGLDYLAALANVNASRITVSGLSMGGEITTWVAAMDPRLAMAVVAGYSPDYQVLNWHGSHGCWKWLNSEIYEYIDHSDLLALIAPRPLIVETGRLDYIFSAMTPPFASDKQVMRRARSFYTDVPDSVFHYLHYDVHHFHVGGTPLNPLGESQVHTPVYIAPVSPGSLEWQFDGITMTPAPHIYSIMQSLVP